MSFTVTTIINPNNKTSPTKFMYPSSFVFNFFFVIPSHIDIYNLAPSNAGIGSRLKKPRFIDIIAKYHKYEKNPYRGFATAVRQCTVYVFTGKLKRTFKMRTVEK